MVISMPESMSESMPDPVVMFTPKFSPVAKTNFNAFVSGGMHVHTGLGPPQSLIFPLSYSKAVLTAQ